MSKLTLFLLCLLPSALVFGNLGTWTLIDNFSSGNADAWTLSGTDSNTVSSGYKNVIPDPTDPSNMVLDFFTDGTFDSVSLRAYYTLPTVIPGTQEAATFFYRTYATGPDVNSAAGLSWHATPNNWDRYRSLVFVQSQSNRTDDPNLIYRDGGGNAPAWDTLETGTWYSIWQVIYPQTKTFDVYIQGGQWVDQTLVVAGAGMRDQHSENVDYQAVLLSNEGWASPHRLHNALFDDIYVDYTGVNLTVVPEPSHAALALGLLAVVALVVRRSRRA